MRIMFAILAAVYVVLALWLAIDAFFGFAVVAALMSINEMINGGK